MALHVGFQNGAAVTHAKYRFGCTAFSEPLQELFIQELASRVNVDEKVLLLDILP
jgi:hypothetical protein